MTTGADPTLIPGQGNGTYTGFDPTTGAEYQSYYNTANQAYQNALGQITAQRDSYLQQSGLAADPNTGKITGVLGNAPGGGFQQTLLGAAQGADAAQAASAGSILGGGLRAQSDEAAQAAGGQQIAGYLGGVQGNLSNYLGQQQQTTDNFNNDLVNEQNNLVQQAIQNGTFNPGNPGSTAPGTDGWTFTGTGGQTTGSGKNTNPGAGSAPKAQATTAQRVATVLKHLQGSTGNLTAADAAKYKALYRQLTGRQYKGKLGKVSG